MTLYELLAVPAPSPSKQLNNFVVCHVCSPHKVEYTHDNQKNKMSFIKTIMLAEEEVDAYIPTSSDKWGIVAMILIIILACLMH